MVSFQQDIILTIDKYNQEYQNKIQSVMDNPNLFTELSLDEAKKLINYIKQYKTLMSSVSLIIDKINNIKEDTSINKKIENELYAKIFPIMNIYRTLLYQKYNISENNNNNPDLFNSRNIIQNLNCINSCNDECGTTQNSTTQNSTFQNLNINEQD